jgi:paraquat-inducible protein B
MAPQRGRRPPAAIWIINIMFLALAASLLWRDFRRGGGLRMLKMMNAPMAHEHAHGHGHA